MTAKRMVNVGVGVFGLLAICIGAVLEQSPEQELAMRLLYVGGGIALLYSAWMEKVDFFIALQTTAVASAISVFVPPLPMLVAPLVGFFAFRWLYRRGGLAGWNLVGFAGGVLVVIAFGNFGVSWAMITAAATLCVYSIGSGLQGVSIAWLWGALNFVLVLSAARGMGLL